MRRKLLNLCMTALLSVVTTAAWALSDVNGVYQISSAADWEEFAALVNGGEVNACAVLTTDIDTGIDGTMIGVADVQGQRYDGTFDGQGHTIKINLFHNAEYTGIFRYIGWRAVIQNLKVTGSISTENKYAGGIVGSGRGIVRNCWSDVVIKSLVPGDATHGGIVAYGFSGTIVENCLVQTAIVGETTTNCGGVVGWAYNPVNIVNCLIISDDSAFDLSTGLSRNIARNDTRVNAINVETYNADPYGYRSSGAGMGACYNNYVTNEWGGSNPATTVVATADLADGRICYQLNNDQSRIAWVQNIGTDLFPVPAAFGTGRVYASAPTDCDGKAEGDLTFSNSGTDQATKHTFDKYGVCTVCGCFNFNYFDLNDPTKFDQKDRAVFLRTKEDIDVAEGMNRMCNGFKLNMKMDADIKYVADAGKYIFNSIDWIDGNFNGQGHTFEIEMSDLGNPAGLFPEMDGNVENLIVTGSIQTNGGHTGSVCGNARNALIRNVYSNVNINSSVVGDNTSGGMFGWTGDKEKRVENCIYAGTFTLPGADGGAECARVGGFSGWTATKTYYTNCAMLGNIIGAGDQTLDSDTENSQNIARYPPNVVTENVYVLNPIYGNDVSDHDKYIHYENVDGVASGELAYLLNGKKNGLERFYQLIGTDPEPMPIAKQGALVYANAPDYKCDGTPLGKTTYSNTDTGEAVIPPHTYVDGFCSVCGKFQEDFLTPVDGFFEIGSGQDLYWWALYAVRHPSACAKLTADIDMANYSDRYAHVEAFSGEFDGQGHTISNLVMENDNNYNGLIATLANGAKIHDLILDETCSLYSPSYAGVIGGTLDQSGTVYITNVGFEGTVGVNSRNAAGIIGVCHGGTMNMMITNCWVTGTITGGAESGAICGYSGSGSIVKNCWSTCQMPSGSIYSSDSFTRGAAQVINCYEADIEGVDKNKQQHYNPTAANRLTITLPLEDVESGALCYNLNGKQFVEPTWFQTLEEDLHPYPFGNRGVVIAGAGQYFSIPNNDLNEVVSAIQSAENDAFEDVIATQSLLDEFDAAVKALDNVEDLEALGTAIEAINAAKAKVEESAKAYEAYIAKCEEVKDYLENYTDFSGTKRTALEAYLSEENVDGPDAVNTLGSYEYIIDVHTATTEEIIAETKRVEDWLAEAIAEDIAVGADVSSMIPNSDFIKQNESWTGGFGSSFGQTMNDEGKTFVGVEAWNRTGDMFQTVGGFKPGYYLIGTNAAFRPSNDRYSTNYAAGIYANGIFNYFPAVIEDPVLVGDAQDGVNCNLSIKSSYDLSIYDDYNSTSDEQAAEVGAEKIGYVVHGETGMAIAAKAGRYPVYTIAKVGEDGKLTIGIKNPGTKYSNDWTGWGSLTIKYCGTAEVEAANAALYTTLDNMVARANTILAYKYNTENARLAPNFPAALKADLQAAVAAYTAAKKAETAPSTEKLEEFAETFSTLFQAIYEGKQAYIALHKVQEIVEKIPVFNMNLANYDEETDQWSKDETAFVFSEEEKDALYDYGDALLEGYEAGAFSTEEALNPAVDPKVAEIIPAQDEDGYYLIGTTKQFVAFHTIASEVDNFAKGKLTADVDMAGVTMLPIGHNRGENAVHIFNGEFDGQGHALTNVWIDSRNITDNKTESGEYAEPATLFYELNNATVKNFKLTGVYYNTYQFGGAITRWFGGTSVIDNCEIAVAMHIAPNLKGDTSTGGVIGRQYSANTRLSNCLIKCQLIGEGDEAHKYVGGVAGWANNALKISNTLILSDFTNVGADGTNSKTIARGAGVSATNVFVSRFFGGEQGTLVTAEQLASGEIAWKLNNQTGEDVHWFQTIGTDATPYLFGGDVVYLYGGQYTNEKPNPQLNAFAYNLDAALSTDKVVVNFDLNAEAEAAEVQIVKGEDVIYTQPVEGELTAGSYSVNVPIGDLGGNDPTELNFKISVTGKGSLDVLRMGESYKVWGPYGLAVNNNPESKNFGQVLIAESYPAEPETGYMSSGKPGAIYAFDQNFKPVNSADGAPGFYGGLEIKGEDPLVMSGTFKYEFKDIRFTEDGRLFVARASGLSNSSVYELNPEDLNEPWTPVFTGGELDEVTGITYVGEEEQNRMAISLAFEGKGEDLKMYVLGGQRSDGGNNLTDYNCSIYNLGTAKEWTSAPSASFEPLNGVYTYSPYYVSIHEDGQGGLWYIQRVTNPCSPSEETPTLKHFNAAGEEDYSNISANRDGAKIAFSPDGKYFAMPNNVSRQIVIYENEYKLGDNGMLEMTPKKSVTVAETPITCLAFDWANNLYVASAGTETFARYTIPGINKDNIVVTPGNGIGVDGDCNFDGKVNIADAQYVLVKMANDEYEKRADVNRDGKVNIADYQRVLVIMANQE